MDEMMERSLVADIYGSQPKRLSLLLQAYEMSVSGLDSKVMLPTRLTLEHIAPQTREGTWSSNAGEAGIWEIKCNTIGNMTLLTRVENSRAGNNDWSFKKEMYQKDSLAINRELSSMPTWSIAEIDKRTRKLVQTLAGFFDKEH